MTDELPSELAELYRAERAERPAAASVRAAVRAKVAKSAAAGGLGLAATGKALALLLVIIGTAALVTRASHTTREASAIAPHMDSLVAEIVQPAEPAPIAEPPAHIVQPAPPAARVESPRRPSPAVTPVPAKPSLAVKTDVPESALVRDAWLALASQDPQRALALVHDDVRFHPNGALDEERRAIEIVALARTGHVDLARSATTKFDALYPSSIHRALIAQSLASE